eukprot:929912-Prymnesium_polylepis.3
MFTAQMLSPLRQNSGGHAAARTSISQPHCRPPHVALFSALHGGGPDGAGRRQISGTRGAPRCEKNVAFAFRRPSMAADAT